MPGGEQRPDTHPVNHHLDQGHGRGRRNCHWNAAFVEKAKHSQGPRHRFSFQANLLVGTGNNGRANLGSCPNRLIPGVPTEPVFDDRIGGQARC